MSQKEFFSSRWGLIISTLGIQVGTGNIWRFPRIVATNGGGSFLILWLIFLFLWSLPLIISEFAFGKTARKSPFFAFRYFAGEKNGWMGAFVAFVSTAIMFYYSVVSGWAFYYFFSSLTGRLFITTDYLNYWNNFNSGFLPLLFHLIVMLLSSAIIYRGITAGIEKVNRVLVTSLVVMLIILLVRAVTLPGAVEGLKRKKSILTVGSVGSLFGIPSALNVDFLINQDWVWGIALLISGAFIAMAINKYGVNRFRGGILNNTDSDLKVGKWFNFLIKFVISAEVIVLISWWLFSPTSWDPQWWHTFHRDNLCTSLFQWGSAIILLIILNGLYNNYKKVKDY